MTMTVRSALRALHQSKRKLARSGSLELRGQKMLSIPPLGNGEGVMHYHIRWSNSKVD